MVSCDLACRIVSCRLMWRSTHLMRCECLCCVMSRDAMRCHVMSCCLLCAAVGPLVARPRCVLRSGSVTMW